MNGHRVRPALGALALALLAAMPAAAFVLLGNGLAPAPPVRTFGEAAPGPPTLVGAASPSTGAASGVAVSPTPDVFPPGPPALAGPGDWPAYLHDPGRSAVNLNESILSPSTAGRLQPLWTFHASAMVLAQPIEVGGRVFVGSWNGYEYALNASTGSQVWATSLNTSYSGNCTPPLRGITSAPTWVAGTLYVGGGGEWWYALNASNGSPVWKFFTGNASNGFYNWASPLVFGGEAYIGISSMCDNPLIRGALEEVTLSNHSLAHTFYTAPITSNGSSIWSSPTVDPATRAIFLTTGNGPTQGYPDAVISLNGTTLAKNSLWQVPPLQKVPDGDFGAGAALVADAGGRSLVVAVNKNGLAYALNESNLSRGPLWTDRVADPGNCPQCGGGSISPPTYDGARLYLAGGAVTVNGTLYPGSVRAVDPATGAVLWQTIMLGPVLGAVTVADGLVVAGAGPYVEVLDAGNGTLLYSVRLGGLAWSAPSVANGCIFQGDVSGNVTALALPGGRCTPPPSPLWVPLHPTTVPAGRDSASLIYDAALHKLLLFGGRGAAGARNDTWSYRGGAWVPIALAVAPPPRWSAAIGYDPISGVAVLFGGQNGTGYFADTWEFRSGAWRTVPSLLSPSPRSGSALGWDAIAHRLVLFGGRDASGSLSDTWTYSAGQWIQHILPAGPPGRSGAALAAQAANGSLVLTGGVNGTSVENDLWSWTSGGWRSLAIPGLPPHRTNATVATEGSDPSLLLFGGLARTSAGSAPMGDTWRYSGGSWSGAAPSRSPPARWGASSAYDGADRYLLLFGGNGSNGSGPGIALSDTWVYAPVLRANASFSPNPTDVGMNVSFRGNFLGGAFNVTFGWDFGDGNRSAVGSPVHVYGSAGTRLVQLWVNDSLGQRARQTLSVPVNGALSGTFNVSRSAIDLGQSVYVNLTTVGGSTPVSVSLTGLPPGCPLAPAPSLRCVPNATGRYVIRATATDAPGATVSFPLASLQVYPPLSVQLVLTRRVIDAGQTTTVTAVVTGGAGSSAVTFGGLPAGCMTFEGFSAVCTPSVAGTFHLTGTGTDRAGASNTTSPTDLTVNPGLSTTLGLSSAQVTLGTSATWNTSVLGGTPPYAVTYRGLPGGCPTTVSFVLTCVPAAIGVYNVSTTVTDGAAAHASASGVLTVTRVNSTPRGPGPAAPSHQGIPALYLVGAGVGAAAILAMLVVLYRQRRRASQGSRSPLRSEHRPGQAPASRPPLRPPAG